MLIVLSRPVEPIAPLIEAVLSGWNDPAMAGHALLPCRKRPVDPEAVPLMLKAVLEGSLPPGRCDDEKALLSLPNLEQCFLRSIDGWGGIDRLRQVALERRDRFWLLGCNSWAWKFLDHVSQISSYFPEARILPAVEGAALRDWLAPVATDLAPAGSAGQEADAELWCQLAELGAGCSRIAAELWVRGLRLDPDGGSQTLRQVRPSLPDLPSLIDDDRYLLHSLLIHGTMRRNHLAFGLGLPSHRLQPRIQWLLGEGLITESAGELSVRPSHYPCLVKELASNNFFTGDL